MNQKIVTLLLTPCLLLAQTAALFGHSHGDGKSSDTQLKPHVHAQQVLGKRHHGHHHGGFGHHHVHHHDDHLVDSENALGVNSASWPHAEHDSDAIYLPGPHSIVTLSFGGINHETSSRVLAAARFLYFPSTSSGLTRARFSGERPIRAPSCPLYVRQCALLI